jgi:hypothetical protein
MNLPAGFAVHCATCNVVVPADAPRPAAGGDCAFVVRNKLARWYANETIKGQHTAATAAWKLIHHEAVEGPAPDAACVAYWQQYRKDPKKHFCSSAARAALTPEQVQEQLAKVPQGATVKFDFHRIAKARRDAHFYE